LTPPKARSASSPGGSDGSLPIRDRCPRVRLTQPIDAATSPSAHSRLSTSPVPRRGSLQSGDDQAPNVQAQAGPHTSRGSTRDSAPADGGMAAHDSRSVRLRSSGQPR
jgi:hypothetical protein